MIHNQTKFPFNSNFFLDRQAGLPIENEMDWDNHDGRSRPYQYTWTPLPNTNVGNNFIFSATRDGQLHAGHGIEPGDWIDLYIGSIPYPFEVLSIENNHEIRINLNGLTGPFSGFKKRVYPGMNFDPDALNFIYRVEQQDGQALPSVVRKTIDDLIKGAKAQGVWSTSAQFTLGAGARTLAGNLVPLLGPALTNTNFVQGDSSSTHGITGNGSNKYLVGVPGNTFGQDDFIAFCYVTSPIGAGVAKAFLGNGTSMGSVRLLKSSAGDQFFIRTKGTGDYMSGIDSKTISGLTSTARNAASSAVGYVNGSAIAIVDPSTGNVSQPISWFSNGAGAQVADARMFGFYYGPYSNPAIWRTLLDQYYTAIQAAYP